MKDGRDFLVYVVLNKILPCYVLPIFMSYKIFINFLRIYMRFMIGIVLFLSFVISMALGREFFTVEQDKYKYSVDVRVIIASDYIDKGDYSKAEVLLNYVLDFDKNHKEANLLMQDIKKHQEVL
jgi:hypothetical protein